MSEKLKETVPDQFKKPLFVRSKKSFNPLQLFVDTAFAARLWFIVALVLLGFVAIQPYLTIQAYRGREHVVVMDGAGTYSISPLLDFEEAKDLHENITLLATMALLSQNPNGLDYPEMMERIFYKDAREKAERYQEANKGEFSQKELHQKQQVFSVKILKTRENIIMAQVKGELIRCGVFENANLVENMPFTLNLKLVRNPDMITNKRFPLAVYDYDLYK